MYIKTFEDVRKYILTNTHINLFVEYGLSNLFGTVMVDPAFYVLEKDGGTKNNDAGQLKAAANAETGLYCNKEIKFFQKTFDKSKSRGYNKIQYLLKCSEGNE